MDSFEVREPKSRDELNAIFRQRAEIWVREGYGWEHFPGGVHYDQFDEISTHFGAYEDGKLIGSSRLTITSDLGSLPDSFVYVKTDLKLPIPIGSLNRLIVLPEARGRGIAKAMDGVRCKHASKAGCKSMIGYVEAETREAALNDLGFRVIRRDQYTHRISKKPMTIMMLLT